MKNVLIFDFDGTILDTETPVFEAWKDLYSRFDQVLAMEDYALTIGTDHSQFSPQAELEKRVGSRFDWNEWGPKLKLDYRERIERRPILPDVVDLIDQARQKNWHLAVASSSTSDWVVGHLQRLGLHEKFDFISCADAPQRPKPAPDVYLRVLNHFEISSDAAIALEDSPNGAKAAIAAGIRCYGIPNPSTKLLDFPKECLKVKSLKEVLL